MRLKNHREFVKEFFEKPRPSKDTVRDWVESGEVPGKVLGDRVYVDVNRFISNKPVRSSSIPDLLG